MVLPYLLALSAAIDALPSPQLPTDSSFGPGHVNEVVYFLDNDPAGCSIVALQAEGQTLVNPVKTSTGGLGAHGENAQGVPNMADSTFSQGIVVVDGNYLFTVNPGSGTVVAFAIDALDPVHPRMLGQPRSTYGDFPVSITYSSESSTVCVLNGGSQAGVSCYHLDARLGVSPDGVGLRVLPNFTQSTPEKGPPSTASEIIFSPDGCSVIAITKGNAATGIPGQFVSYPVTWGDVGTTPTVSAFNNIAMPFGSIYNAEGNLFVSDPSFGVAILSESFTELAHTVVPSQKALCWAEVSVPLHKGFGIDAGAPIVYIFDANTAELKSKITTSVANGTSNGGNFDAKLGEGNRMYVLSETPGIAVLDVEREVQIGYVDLSDVGPRANFQGMAVWSLGGWAAGGW